VLRDAPTRRWSPGHPDPAGRGIVAAWRLPIIETRRIVLIRRTPKANSVAKEKKMLVAQLTTTQPGNDVLVSNRVGWCA
jgi:hypothetical protein